MELASTSIGWRKKTFFKLSEIVERANGAVRNLEGALAIRHAAA
jgi:hypothetical protein